MFCYSDEDRTDACGLVLHALEEMPGHKLLSAQLGRAIVGVHVNTPTEYTLVEWSLVEMVVLR